MCWFSHLQHVNSPSHETQTGLFHSCLWCVYCLTFLPLRNTETIQSIFQSEKQRLCPLGIISVTGLHLSNFLTVRHTRSYDTTTTFTCTIMTCTCVNAKKLKCFRNRLNIVQDLLWYECIAWPFYAPPAPTHPCHHTHTHTHTPHHPLWLTFSSKNTVFLLSSSKSQGSAGRVWLEVRLDFFSPPRVSLGLCLSLMDI